MVTVMAACSVSYKFNGASIDYTKTKTIQIADFPIRSSYVWGPMGPMFNNELKDKFASNTQLIQVLVIKRLTGNSQLCRYSREVSVAFLYRFLNHLQFHLFQCRDTCFCRRSRYFSGKMKMFLTQYTVFIDNDRFLYGMFQFAYVSILPPVAIPHCRSDPT